MTTIKEIKEVNPKLAQDYDVINIANNLDKYKDLRVMAESPAGKTLSKNLKTNIDNLTAKLLANYQLLSHIELVSLIAELKSTKTLYDTLVEAKFLEAQKETELEETLKLKHNAIIR